MKLSVSTGTLFNRFGIEQSLRMMKEAGFDCVDYGLDRWHPDRASVLESQSYRMSEEETVAQYQNIKKLADEIGIEIYQTHAIFGEFPACDCEEYVEATVKNIIATHTLGCRYSVIHPVRTPGRFFDEKKEEGFEFNLRLFQRLLPYLEKYDVVIGIEPMWLDDENRVICPSVCSRPEEILEFIRVLGDKHFCACLDYGHVALTGKGTGDTVGGAIRKLGQHMKIVHIHEVDGVWDNHNAPYTYPDVMDWDDIIAAMRGTGYAGTVNFEVGPAYYNNYPDRLIPEALRHLAAIGRDILDQIQ